MDAIIANANDNNIEIEDSKRRPMASMSTNLAANNHSAQLGNDEREMVHEGGKWESRGFRDVFTAFDGVVDDARVGSGDDFDLYGSV